MNLSQRSSHTYCQAPRANAQAKACQRVCLSHRTDRKEKARLHNSVYSAFGG